MTNPVPEKQEQKGFPAWLKRNYIALLGLVVALGVMGAIVFFYFKYPDLYHRLEGYGYLGTFVISLILNGTILLPVSNMAVITALGATLPVPLFVGLAGGPGAAIGELSGYLAGRSGRGLLAGNRMYLHVEGWVKRWGWLAVFILSIVPFAFDIVGIIAGALRMPVWRFMVACAAGRTIAYIFMAYMGSLGLNSSYWFFLVAAGVVLLVVGIFLFIKFKKRPGAVA
jgi:uncharacterized membrane protein YdjX (TVP38/TMEM64 family)